MEKQITYRSPYRTNTRTYPTCNRQQTNSTQPKPNVILVQSVVSGLIFASILVVNVLSSYLDFNPPLRENISNAITATSASTDTLVYTLTAKLQEIIPFLEITSPAVAQKNTEEATPVLPVFSLTENQQQPSPAPPQTYHHQVFDNTTFNEKNESERTFIENLINKIAEESDTLIEDVHQENSKLTLNPPILPAQGSISSLFGERTNPVTGLAELHNGLDLALEVGTPVMAIQNGIVTEIGEDEYSGKYLRYATDDGFIVGYAHLSETKTEIGKAVTQGDVLALSGSTGQTTGPHLHITIWEKGVAIDPLLLFRT